MSITVEKALRNNQSILHNFGLVEELDEQAAEIISGGTNQSKNFTITNNTTGTIFYTVDDAFGYISPGQKQNFNTKYDGKMSFDKDISPNDINVQQQDLKDGKAYQFIPSAGNPNIIQLV
ncbi:hypothetical protein [Nostoc sp. 'Peltigera membranacea cyanobiont' N6]|uniref:hypothetical protein n=1 Tax=Nostoc sp. 'Peltigera membranacea cyanobiont' N6 TaxID=1261031 RepID=UPI000CF31535|nr:hypothetical protein [Nostoc sp. 'Peltigera membranacea cyanobiont' N6]AVH65119.1 hypothetical protein NPM_3525 [Nostoc sp. 'Peltigera membranacea cyanobiont' N6]